MLSICDPTLESYILVYRNIQIAYRGQLYSTMDPFHRCLDFCNNFFEILGIVDGDWVHEDGFLTNAGIRDSRTADQGLCNPNRSVKSVNPHLTRSSTLGFVYFSSKFLSIDPTLYSRIVVTVSSMAIFESFIWIGRIAPGSFWISIWISTKIMIYWSFRNIFRFMGIISIPFLAFSARFRFTLKVLITVMIRISSAGDLTKILSLDLRYLSIIIEQAVIFSRFCL